MSNPVEHPLPWRWEKDSYEPADGCWGSMVDARGEKLIGPTNLDGILSVADEYVRAVTERAGAMEQTLRRLVARVERLNNIVDNEYGYDADDHVERLEAEALLAEIDAAKAGAKRPLCRNPKGCCCVRSPSPPVQEAPKAAPARPQLAVDWVDDCLGDVR